MEPLCQAKGQRREGWSGTAPSPWGKVRYLQFSSGKLVCLSLE